MKNKSSLKDIESRFDKDVERFSNLETGQRTTLDAKFNMDLICESIACIYPNLQHVLDIGCGAGNYDVNLLRYIQPKSFTLVDLSQPMLDKAKVRLAEGFVGAINLIKGDFAQVDLAKDSYDVIIATAVLHHLRSDQDWKDAFAKLFSLLKEGGSLWVFDLVWQHHPSLQRVIYNKYYGDYLTSLQDESYRDHVFEYIDQEDSPRDLILQINMLQEVGFGKIDVLHKNLSFASYVAFK